ncbi:PREDICTED: UDP-glucuronosyltransferase 2B15-like isoform X1 [Elephantulus edwardii]|uniref:UDP-glucuronosyltransferase 2B15-like isoform X1 n=1 Tax=Elephantulus edwardii TaxID=28737 RepID=UPI0003F0A4CA|nr:PREDICTED: UDP-glucuronosyltransferase 2B15-like isoform X1 [Elephantulus edwardii]
MPMKWISVFLLIQLSCYFSPGACGKVLVWPTEYSHWINIKTVLDELTQKGHEVTVLTSSAAIFVNPSKSSTIKFEVFPTSFTKENVDTLIKELINVWMQMPKYTLWTQAKLMQEVFSDYSDYIEKLCKEVVFNKKIMIKLQESKFDVVLADAIGLCGELLAQILKIPLVYSIRFTSGYTIEKYSGGLVAPPSYVPVIYSELSDRMTFMERIKNMIYVLYLDFWFQSFNEKKWNQFYSEVLGRQTTLIETMGKADIWLVRTSWDFEFPRPLLPHFVFVGGLHCKPAKPLPKEIEEFVQSSGNHGIVVFTLGSMITNMSEDKANMIASALAQIPQKVLWRFNGKTPDTLGHNTQLYKWLPQNDLLGHPKTKAFITHGGTNGIYEAIYHGIPMIGIPLFADQADNILRVKAKGAAVSLKIDTMTSKDLLQALQTVINNPLYKENAMKLSAIHHDQPVKPLDQAVFWIEFVMRHKGAKHLRPASLNLTWAQYHSLDVIGFLLACVAIVTFIVLKSCLFCYQVIFKKGKKKKRE